MLNWSDLFSPISGYLFSIHVRSLKLKIPNTWNPGTLNNYYKVGPPSDVSWFINPMNTIVIGTINHSDIGLICTNLAIVWGPHFVQFIFCDIHTVVRCTAKRLRTWGREDKQYEYCKNWYPNWEYHWFRKRGGQMNICFNHYKLTLW